MRPPGNLPVVKRKPALKLEKRRSSKDFKLRNLESVANGIRQDHLCDSAKPFAVAARVLPRGCTWLTARNVETFLPFPEPRPPNTSSKNCGTTRRCTVSTGTCRAITKCRAGTWQHSITRVQPIQTNDALTFKDLLT